MKNTNPLSHIFSCLFQGFTGTVRCLCWWYLGQFLPCQSNRSALPFNQREHRFSSAFFYSYLYLDAQMTILMGDIETTWRESLSSSMGGPEFFSILTVTLCKPANGSLQRSVCYHLFPNVFYYCILLRSNGLLLLRIPLHRLYRWS